MLENMNDYLSIGVLLVLSISGLLGLVLSGRKHPSGSDHSAVALYDTLNDESDDAGSLGD